MWFKWVGQGTGGSGAEKLLDKTVYFHDWYIYIHRAGIVGENDYNKCIGWGTYEGSGASLSWFGSTHETDGKWHHIVVTYDNTNGVMYVDGVEVASGTVRKVNSSGQMMISYTPSSDSNQRGKVNCWLDNYSIWKKTLTAEDVAWLYNNGEGVEYPYTKPLPAGYADVEEWQERVEIETAVEESLADEPESSIAKQVINPKTVVLIDSTKEPVEL